MTDKPDPAQAFKDMADRIAKNPDEYQGAYVVVGPDGVIVSNAFFGPKPNVALFWSTTKSHIEIEAIAASDAAERKNNPGGFGRR